VIEYSITHESFQGEKQVNRQNAEEIIAEYLKPVFGFALKRCRNMHDAEDLSQEIVFRAYRALLAKDDIEDAGKFIWTVAHNALANYYRDTAKQSVGVPIDDMEEHLADPDAESFDADDNREALAKMQSEIAYLSKLQRRIVIAYYYENRKQAQIAEELGIPLGTVKWHLFEVKKELKRGMETMRKASELKFNPIKFSLCGFNGSSGTKGAASNFLRSPLSQNIEYAVWKEAKTVSEIADALGVSPVYVESEAEFLEEYGFLTKHGDKYLCNILLDEPTDELTRLHDEMYAQAAKIFANELYDELTTSGILDDSAIWGSMTEPFTFTYDPPKDKNFMRWALIPYIAALSGESLMDKSIAFENAYTIRPDGGKNICYASVIAPDVKSPLYFDSMKRFCGPCWNGLTDKFIVWTIDSEWSERRVTENYHDIILHDLTLLNHVIQNDVLSIEEYAYLTERGYISVISGNYNKYKSVTADVKNHKTTNPVTGCEQNPITCLYKSCNGTSVISDINEGCTKYGFRCLYLSTTEIKNRLIAIGARIKEKHKAEFDALKATYIKAVLDATPKQLLTMQKYGLQYIFYSDGWFLLHCMKELVNNGKLKPPTEEQRKSLTTLIVPNK